MLFDSLEMDVLWFSWAFCSSLLSSFFVVIIVIIKTPLNHCWFIMKLCFHNLPLFDDDNFWNQEIHTHTHFFLVDHSYNCSPFFFEFMLILNLNYLLMWVLDLSVFLSPFGINKKPKCVSNLKVCKYILNIYTTFIKNINHNMK